MTGTKIILVGLAIMLLSLGACGVGCVGALGSVGMAIEGDPSATGVAEGSGTLSAIGVLGFVASIFVIAGGVIFKIVKGK